MKNPRILVVDDEPSIICYIKRCLSLEKYKPLVANNGIDAIELVKQESPDLMILDIGMPKLNGYEVCKRIREWSSIPIIMLSAYSSLSDKVKSLDLGADDYMTKPFGMGELTARIRAVLRRSKSEIVPAPESFNCDDLNINFGRKTVILHEKKIELTPTEFKFLEYLAKNPEKVLSHKEILKHVWGDEYRDEKHYLHVFASRLRRKIPANHGYPPYISTIPFFGYQIRT